MNTVVLTSVLSAGNHALFAGTRVLYGALPFTIVLHLPDDH
jgi:amino acid permease